MLKRFEKPAEAAELTPEPPTADVRLLTEIRDLLARRAD
jgi:large-conductance mechanosensitive channel